MLFCKSVVAVTSHAGSVEYQVLWFQFLKRIQKSADIAAQYGVEIILKRCPDEPDRECCKI